MQPRTFAIFVLAIFALSTANAGAAASFGSVGSSTTERYVLGFEPGQQLAAQNVAEKVGAKLLKLDGRLGVAVLHATPAVARLLASSPVSQFFEKDTTFAVSSTVDPSGIKWNGVKWNGIKWNGEDMDNESAALADPGLPLQWGIDRVNASGAWNVTTGNRSATLCIVDSGIDASHPDLAANLWRDASGAVGWNAVNNTPHVPDAIGHGTHMAGVAAGVVANDVGTAGVGNVRVMTAKALNDTGVGFASDVALGVKWCSENGARVILLALSSTESSSALDRALSIAADRDSLLVAAAGNNGPCDSCITYPASNPRVIAVSALASDDTLAPFSASGSKMELTAPGVDIVGAFPDSILAPYAYGSGTSQASALVAGLAALVRDTNSTLTAKQTRQLLSSTAVDIGSPDRDVRFGNGVIDVGRAVRVAANVAESEPALSTSNTTSTNTTTTDTTTTNTTDTSTNDTTTSDPLLTDATITSTDCTDCTTTNSTETATTDNTTTTSTTNETITG